MSHKFENINYRALPPYTCWASVDDAKGAIIDSGLMDHLSDDNNIDDVAGWMHFASACVYMAYSMFRDRPQVDDDEDENLGYEYAEFDCLGDW